MSDLSEEQLRALHALLTLAEAEPRGLTGALLMMHGLSPPLLFRMEQAGLITAEGEFQVRKFRITPAGRTALGLPIRDKAMRHDAMIEGPPLASHDDDPSIPIPTAAISS
jgi:hypothetical protein